MAHSRFAVPAAILATSVVLGLAAWQGYVRFEGTEGPRVVTVGLYENAPKIYTAEDGQPAGLFVELLNEMAQSRVGN